MGAHGHEEGQPTSTLDAGTWLMATLAILLATLYLLYFLLVDDFRTQTDALQQLLKLVFGGALPALLFGGTYWLSGRDIESDDRWRVAMWCLGGLSALTLLTAYKFYVESFEAGSLNEPFETLLLNGQAGAVAGLLVGIYDVQARTQSARAEDARDQVRFLNQLLRHNILNGVTLMEGYAETYQNDRMSAEEFVQTVQSQCVAIVELIDKARALEQVTGDTDDLEPVDLVTAVSDQLTLFESSYQHVTFETDLPDRVLVVANDLLSALVENLVRNAIEHHDGDEPTVWVSIETLEDDVRLVVEDDGPGISDRMKQTVFIPDAKGTPHGLGLYLVKSLATHYGGDVWAEDNDPRGARFVVSFPNADERGTGER